ncbi:uncharacterized protein LOC122713748 [Apis laboriosa]|uniref:uncharacterized protein LOC122713748 n=1 Tax=Apis laboriosa TaxID=183418 RepID=UPI001CC6D9B1|nr:uncharacterized protein LOC122713748 [Apis laboriosa]XP_043790417.1 uncharacterized protein LOC122713748 [Apis laboriosa]
MEINESFYKNVFLLMQVVPASYECKKSFNKEMFNKPNTLGFIHISHYLLSVHNATRFQKMVIWPLLNKMDEKKYRLEITEYLKILATENPDINFPPIIMSHLLQAGGRKILILMWKISEISLRAYIINKCQIQLLRAPNIGDNKYITQTYFNIINIKRNNAISKFHENIKLNLKSFEYYMQCKSTDLAKVQTAIFEVKENIEKLMSIFSINPLIAKRLTNLDDAEIINLWKKSIDQNIKFLKQKNMKLQKLKILSNTLYDLILNLRYFKYFDGKNLPKINNGILSLCLNNNIQSNNNELYTNGCLVFRVLLSIIDQVLKQLQYYLKENKLSDISHWNPKIIEYCETIKCMEKIFQNLITEISDSLSDIKYSLQEKSINYTLDKDFLSFINLKTILTSPKFNIFIDNYINDEEISKKILVSPIKDGNATSTPNRKNIVSKNFNI